MPVGTIPPEDVHVPCIFVDRVIKRTGHQKRIEVMSCINTLTSRMILLY